MKKISTFLKLSGRICSFALLLASSQVAKAQIILSEGFEGSFPPTGWAANITNNPGGSSSASSFNWQGMPNGGGNPGINAHSGSTRANYNSFWVYSGGSAELVSPAIDLSSYTNGANNVSFWMYRYYGSDQLEVYINTSPSSSGGTLLGTITNSYSSSPAVGNTGWYSYSYAIPPGFSSATNYIIFRAVSSYGDDINIDDVSIVHIPPCSGVPSGSITAALPCPGSTFQISYTDTLAANLSYQWQSSTNGVSWVNAGSTGTTLTTSIASPTYFRVAVTCQATGLSDTASTYVETAPFYLCYCNDSISGYYDANIGSVVVRNRNNTQTVLNNGNPSPILNNSSATNTYTDYSNVTPAVLYLDSVYNFSITQVQSGSFFYGSPVNIYIDFNRDGVYEPTELVFNSNTTSSANPVATDTVRVPMTATVGLTGMRILLEPFSSTPLDPCTQYYAGEVEDYVVNISNDPCHGPTNAGTATVTDSSLCPGLGYTFTLSDVNHERQLGNIQWSWQQSPDNGYTWGPVPNTIGRDTVTLSYMLPVWYRMRMICLGSHDTTYSNVIKMKDSEPYACYCYSQAVGGRIFDSTDVGAFGIGNYLFQKPASVNNPHVANPQAVKGHSDYTRNIIHLNMGETYHVAVYQVLKSEASANAKVTMFIDYNNSLVYDIPAERVWTAYTTADSFFLTTDITIPVDSVIPNVYTGMRVIINNNTSPNVPSDDACGAYTSGETQDYVVMLHDAATAGVGSIKNLHDMVLFPNPTSGKSKLQFVAAEPVKQLMVRVSSITGQTVYSEEHNNVSGEFATELDLGKEARGVYFVEIIADGQRNIRKLIVQ